MTLNNWSTTALLALYMPRDQPSWPSLHFTLSLLNEICGSVLHVKTEELQLKFREIKI
jgi:hypothetical protein